MANKIIPAATYDLLCLCFTLKCPHVYLLFIIPRMFFFVVLFKSKTWPISYKKQQQQQQIGH